MFFSRTKILWVIGIVSTIIIILMFYKNNPYLNIVASALSAIVVSIVVSFIYNDELHKAMNRYQRIGLVNYFDNFEDAHDIIKDKISNAKVVDIFVMYGDSFLNTSTKALKSVLSKDNSTLRYAMYSLDNPFIKSYGNHWGIVGENPKYNENGLKLKITGVRDDLNGLCKHKHPHCKFELYEILSSPISYSFYRVDNELFFVPSKNIQAKEIKPAVFHFKKTKSEYSKFEKVKNEFDLMISNNEVIKVEL